MPGDSAEFDAYMASTAGGTAPGGVNTSSYTVNRPIGNPMGEQEDEVQTTTIITPGSNNNNNVTSFTPNPDATPADEFERLRLLKDQLQNVPAGDGIRNEYQMGIQNLLDMGDNYKDAYLDKYPIGGNINLNMKPLFAHVADAYQKGKEKTKDVVESIKEWATSGPDEASESEDFDFITQSNPQDVHQMKKGGIVHAAEGVFAESETVEMPLTMPEIKRHRKKLEEGFQYDIEVDGKDYSFSFNERIGPSGIAALREREGITPFDTGLNMYGGGQFAEGNTPEARRALEILKSIDPNQPGHFHMQGGTALDYKANGGYMKAFPNQNLNVESLSASDNIDNRIMKNLQFEQMSPGMMGYNTGGIVEPMAPDFNKGI